MWTSSSRPPPYTVDLFSHSPHFSGNLGDQKSFMLFRRNPKVKPRCRLKVKQWDSCSFIYLYPQPIKLRAMVNQGMLTGKPWSQHTPVRPPRAVNGSIPRLRPGYPWRPSPTCVREGDMGETLLARPVRHPFTLLGQNVNPVSLWGPPGCPSAHQGPHLKMQRELPQDVFRYGLPAHADKATPCSASTSPFTFHRLLLRKAFDFRHSPN